MSRVRQISLVGAAKVDEWSAASGRFLLRLAMETTVIEAECGESPFIATLIGDLENELGLWTRGILGRVSVSVRLRDSRRGGAGELEGDDGTGTGTVCRCVLWLISLYNFNSIASPPRKKPASAKRGVANAVIPTSLTLPSQSYSPGLSGSVSNARNPQD